ncbi:MAG TPA: T9SS type A sorting domain-containing protein, partial [Bacteroidia bacterium]|nr:T9SS type A sorting domain-containing protein [Bacteroidia bacterium]
VHDEAKKTSIYIYNLNQQVVLRFENLSIGIGTVNVSANSLPAGNYIYTLQVDGQKIDSKILTVTK